MVNDADKFLKEFDCEGEKDFKEDKILKKKIEEDKIKEDKIKIRNICWRRGEMKW